MNQVTVDFGRTVGAIKPVHGVNNGPVTCNFWYDATPLFQRAHIPYCRLHDTEYPFGNGEYVDICCIFKDFSADENDPNSYNFALTDDYLKYIKKAGADIIYRLGASIEHQPVKLHIYPPKDFLKWAKICEHIIMHYNEGWADGYHMGILYWEIWNEPDLDMNPPRTWTGSQEEFFLFYKTVSVYLKQRFPYLKIGGPAFAHASGDYAEAFFQYLTSFDPPLPLDFYSWHRYAGTADEIALSAKEARQILIRYGYQNTESILDEWNYVSSWDKMKESYQLMGSAQGAAFCASALCTLQHTSVEKAMYYDAQLRFRNEWCGLFVPDHVHTHSIGNNVLPLKPYFAFAAFGKLYELKNEASMTIQGENLYGCAASNAQEQALLLVHFSENGQAPQKISLHWNGISRTRTDIYVLDQDYNLDKKVSLESPPESFELSSYSVVLFILH